jgi:hypothetical protein
MQREHRARITWSSAQQRLGLPTKQRGCDPSWFDGVSPDKGDSWSLLFRFDTPPQEQGNPSEAYVRFLVDEAPHAQLTEGTLLWLFERATSKAARVEILD